MSDKNAILDLLLENPSLVNVFKRILEIEEKHDGDPHFPGWEWHEAGVLSQTLNKLVGMGILEITFKSNKHTYYRLVNREEVKAALKKFEELEAGEGTEEETKIPEDLFKDIIGHDDVKRLLLKAIKSEKPVHILLIGPPASSKTMFLDELSRLPGAKYLLGGALSKVGLTELLFEENPRYLIIDEIDDMPPNEMSILKSLMETGKVVKVKHRKKLEGTFKVWVFAACNNLDRLPHAIKSRFIKIKFKPYTAEEFKVIAKAVAIREGLSGELAEYLAERLSQFTRDPREARGIARVAKTKEEIDEMIETIFGREFKELKERER